MCAKQMNAEGRLKGNAIVATVMSNVGLRKMDLLQLACVGEPRGRSP
jgi:hypothetical protein